MYCVGAVCKALSLSLDCQPPAPLAKFRKASGNCTSELCPLPVMTSQALHTYSNCSTVVQCRKGGRGNQLADAQAESLQFALLRLTALHCWQERKRRTADDFSVLM